MSGTIELRRPRVRGLEARFESRILPLFMRRTKEVTQLLPELYLHGLSQGDFKLALRGLLGDGAPLSTASWLKVLRALRDRGISAPRLVMADGALPIWSAVEQVWPEATQQRCWNHKILNVLDDLPHRVQGPARALLVQMPTSRTRRQAQARRDRFAARYQKRYPAAVATLKRDGERLVTFYDFPQAHWRHLRTTNPVESPFAAVRLRTDAGKRYKRVQGATALIWRVLMVAQQPFRKLNGPERLPAVRAGQKYQDGQPVKQEAIRKDNKMKEAA